MKKLALLISFIPAALLAQVKGINFEHGLNWQEVQAKAKTENKYIFMDCFTTWCGPCRYMSANIFPLQEVGDTMNAHFVSVAVQLDTTASDNAEVKSRYQEGHDIAGEYRVAVYPTYLIFNSNGKIVHRFVGGSNAEAFLKKVAIALDPQTQFYTLLDQYKTGRKDSAFLGMVAMSAAAAYDLETAGAVANEYLASQSNLYTNTNLYFIKQFTHSSQDKYFGLLLNYGSKVDSVIGKGAADKIVFDIIFQEDVMPIIFSKKPGSPKDFPVPDWTAIQSAVTTKYPTRAGEIIAWSKITFYQRTGDWKNFTASVESYLKLNGDALDANQLNEFAWSVFLKCSDADCLTKALAWSERSFTKNQDPAYLDTYANILYKMGKKDDAIIWEKKAVALAPEGDRKLYNETADKMKRGEKTWD
ncbi:MAG: thioredoxin fold domain-containing protein [Ginsengibacter sp.]